MTYDPETALQFPRRQSNTQRISAGPTITFIPNPPPADTGRTKPLAYQVKAQITVEGKTYEDAKIIKQDNVDELRQEYEDMPDRVSQDRGRFDQDTVPTVYERLLDKEHADIEYPRHQWHIVKITNLVQHATDVDNNYQSGDLRVTAGYRCPRGNAAVGGETTSNHQYGKSFDFNQQDSKEENYNAFQAALLAGAGGDSYLKASDGTRYFQISNPPPDPNQLPQGVTYVQGHVTWE